jgi:myo-inositol-1(or 4)-monophosphatase
MNNDDYLKIAVSAAKESAVTFKKFFGRAGKVSTKNGDPNNFFTEIDLAIERQITKKILKHFPAHKIIGEETAKDAVGKNDLVWIIDPIDGTTNYIHGAPTCCISIALWNQKEPLVGVVYSPTMDMLLTAAKGKGASLNGKKIKVSSQANFKLSYGGYGWGRNPERAAKEFPMLLKAVGKVRTWGSSAIEISLVAIGVYDFHFQGEINIWDFAAAVLFVKEAGGRISDIDGKPIGLSTTSIIASNGPLHPLLVKTLKKSRASS